LTTGGLILLKSFNVQTHNHTELIDITKQVQQLVGTSGVSDGICIVFVPHTTAGITINENADPSVKQDILMSTSKFVQEHDPQYQHSEGNSAGHIKASLFGSSVTIILDKKRLLLGTWQGIFFCEFDGPRRRHVHVKLIKG
jgi:secondary thiamine-phosphate synthase enzyme